jgi:hypothetical protein
MVSGRQAASSASDVRLRRRRHSLTVSLGKGSRTGAAPSRARIRAPRLRRAVVLAVGATTKAAALISGAEAA